MMSHTNNTERIVREARWTQERQQWSRILRVAQLTQGAGIRDEKSPRLLPGGKTVTGVEHIVLGPDESNSSPARTAIARAPPCRLGLAILRMDRNTPRTVTCPKTTTPASNQSEFNHLRKSVTSSLPKV
jgi:hypothetical protein